MPEDLLTRIQQEMQERLKDLRGVVEESDQLQADLQALESDLRPEADPRPLLHLQPAVELRPQTDASHAFLSEHSRPSLVSPKVLRLMGGRSSLERPVLARRGKRMNLAREADRFEHAI